MAHSQQMIQKQLIIFQDFFTSVFTGEAITNTPDIVKKQITLTAEMKDIFIRPDDVLGNMKKLKENKSPRN